MLKIVYAAVKAKALTFEAKAKAIDPEAKAWPLHHWRWRTHVYNISAKI